MPTFLVGVDKPNICRSTVWRALEEGALAGYDKLVVLDYRMPRMLYDSINQILMRAEQIVETVLAERKDGSVCVGIASGIVPYRSGINMPPLRYDCAVAVHTTGRQAQCHLNPKPVFLPHEDGYPPGMPLETIHGLTKFIAQECHVLRRKLATQSTKSP